MKKFDKLSQIEIERQKKNYKNNNYRDAFEKVINSDYLKIDDKKDNSRIDTFNRLLNNSIQLVKRRYGFGRIKETDKTFSEIVGALIKENTFYVSSVLDKFINAEGKGIIERYDNAEIMVFKERTAKFLNKYGDEEIFYKGEKTTLSNYYKKYANHEISKEELIDAINFFQLNNEEWQKQNDEVYSKRNSESSNAILEDYVF